MSRILTVNVGSSSVKFAMFDAESHDQIRRELSGQIRGIPERMTMRIVDGEDREVVERELTDVEGTGAYGNAIQTILHWLDGQSGGLGGITATAHRVVHDGGFFDGPVVVDDSVFRRLERLQPLAPEYQPYNLLAIKAVARGAPDMLQVACFDTTFHQTMPWAEQTFALPPEYFEQGLKRYGFHGLSYEYIMSVLPHYAGDAALGRVVVAHLGGGASMCALQAGQSIATTMGLTALDGLPMGKRCGRLDPGLVPYLLQEEDASIEEVLTLLYEQSGLLGVSGRSSDMRVLLASDDEWARRAVELFVYSVCKELGALVACLGGLDVLVFTGGIGKNAAAVREMICDKSGWLGIEIDGERNSSGSAHISTDGSKVKIFALETDEEKILARDALSCIAR